MKNTVPFKGIVHLKMKIGSVFFYPRVIPNQYVFMQNTKLSDFEVSKCQNIIFYDDHTGLE